MFGEGNGQSEKHTQPSYRGITVERGAEIISITQEKFFLEHSLLGATAPCRTIASTERAPTICRVDPYCVFFFPFHPFSHSGVSATHVKKSKLGNQNCEILGTFRKSHALIQLSIVYRSSLARGTRLDQKLCELPLVEASLSPGWEAFPENSRTTCL